MPKPICVIKINLETLNISIPSGMLMSYNEIQNVFNDRLPDYHVFVVPAADIVDEPQEPIQFQVFYEKDFTIVEYNELKEIIKKSLK